MKLIKFNVRGSKISWGKYIAILRESFGVGLLELTGKYVAVGGLTRFHDIAWSGDLLGAVSKRKVLIIDASQGLKSLKEKVVRIEGGTSILGYGEGFVVGTENAELIFINKEGGIESKLKIAEEGKVERLETTSSGAIIAVVNKFNLIIVSPKREVLAHQSYRWDLNKVRWNKDLSWLVVFEDSKIEFMKYEEGQGFVKVKEFAQRGRDAKWCDSMFCLATDDKVLIYRKFDVDERPWLVYTFPCKACEWAPGCKGLAMLGEGLAILLMD